MLEAAPPAIWLDWKQVWSESSGFVKGSEEKRIAESSLKVLNTIKYNQLKQYEFSDLKKWKCKIFGVFLNIKKQTARRRRRRRKKEKEEEEEEEEDDDNEEKETQNHKTNIPKTRRICLQIVKLILNFKLNSISVTKIKFQLNFFEVLTCKFALTTIQFPVLPGLLLG